ncbi:MAG: hypothetical protein IAB76_04865 [Bacteroidetes bacterium]|uniref:Ribosome maturation factor RimP N-terminal domain-containing protein n=1 Tax=Candidatus Cryptobacteroides avistercoris TaxID=2840758 RepID=A0A9D9NPB0_9BACT|nr:hypothetical protein [Candidatus Cryptobacteroides avistercoris]
MERDRFQKVVEDAARERGCVLVGIDFNDDDNVFEVIIDKEDGEVDLSDCEFVHRAVLAAFDRDVEDYALTVSSAGITPDEADEMLETIKE